MKRRPGLPRRQSGIALLALLAMLILAGSFAFYRYANLGGSAVQERETVLQRLARAKDALITYAVIDATRPGRLPCPDLLGDGISPLLSRDDCNAYGGWLPWKTLGLAEYRDDTGLGFRYFLSPLFGGDRSTPPLNSDTATALRLDVPAGAASNDIAAVIIASRGALDARNADGDDYFYNGSSQAGDDNDLIIAVTRQELMAAVEQRIANELRACLEAHSTSATNPQRTYPWPAPLSNAIFKGVDGSLFGMVPDTQSGNPELALKNSITKLTDLNNSLNLPSTVEEAKTQSANLTQLQQVAAYARALFDRLYTVAFALNASALNANTVFTALNTTLANATASSTAFTSLSAGIPGAINDALPSLNTLQSALADSGFDIFLTELQTQNATLAAALASAKTMPDATNLNKLLTSANEFRFRLLNYASTPNPDIDPLIDQGFLAASDAASKLKLAKSTLIQTDIDAALNASQVLYAGNQAIATQILSLRNVSIAASTIAALQQKLAVSDTASNRAELGATLSAANSQVTALHSGTTAMSAARSTSLAALDTALTAINQTTGDLATIQSTATQAAAALNTLATVLNDNVTSESLNAMAATLKAASLQAPDNVTAGRALRSPVRAVVYWSGIAAAQADAIATAARKGIINGIPAQEDSDASAYSAASRLLASLDGSTGSIALLDAYAGKPGDTALATAQSAIANTRDLLSTLIAEAQQLGGTVNAGMALAAVPTAWQGSACALVTPPTGKPTWWTANGWKNYFFYQISDRIRPASGQLTVNGNGAYRHVVLAAGRSIWSNAAGGCDWTMQNRSTIPRTTAAYLENGNAHASRDGDASTPIKTFTAAPVTIQGRTEMEARQAACAPALNFPLANQYPITSFNDRLAY